MVSQIFFMCFSITVLFNIFYILVNPSIALNIGLSFVIGFIASAIATVLLSGVSAFGTGLNDSSTKIIFGVTTILNLLFRINIVGFEIGLGLINNMFEAFEGSPNFIILLLSAFSLITLLSGLMSINGSG